jgi:hypothetical protein
MSDADRITGKLREVRRRQFLLLFLNAASIALLAWIFWTFLCKFNFFALPDPSLMMHLATGVALIIAACIIAVFRMPSWRNTAKLVDAALGLKQRVETSFECIPARDEMDALLLQDTSGRIASIRPAEVVPAQFTRAAKVCFLICLLSIPALGIIRILQSRNPANIGRNGSSMPSGKGLLPQVKNPPKANSSDNPASKQEKSMSLPAYDSASGSGRGLSKDVTSAPEPDNQFRQQSTQGPPIASTADRGVSGTRDLESATAVSSNPRIMPEPGNGAANRPSSPGGAAEENRASSRGNAVNKDNSITRSDAGAAGIRKADRGEGGEQSTAARSGGQATPGGNLPAGQAGLLFPTPIPSVNNAASEAGQSLDYPARWSAAERALAKEKMPPGLKSYIAEYFKAIHP